MPHHSQAAVTIIIAKTREHWEHHAVCQGPEPPCPIPIASSKIKTGSGSLNM